MHCIKCGDNMLASDRFCPSCRANNPWYGAENPSRLKKPDSAHFFAIFGFLIGTGFGVTSGNDMWAIAGPIIGGIVGFLMGKSIDNTSKTGHRLSVRRKTARLVIAVSTAETKECPHCAETIKSAAKICRFCGYDVENIPITTSANETKECPYCAETIKKAAKICHFCGYNVVTTPPTNPTVKPATTPTQQISLHRDS